MKNLLFCLLGIVIETGFISCNNKEILLSDTDTNKISTRTLCETTGLYYYYKGERIPLSVNPNKRYIVMKQNSPQIRSLTASLYNVDDNTTGYVIDVQNQTTVSVKPDTSTLKLLYNNQDIIAIEYVIENDSVFVPLSNVFYVKLKKISDFKLLEQEAAKIGCNIEEAVASDETWIRLSSKKTSAMNSLEASNYLFETGLFADVDPGFLLEFQLSDSPSDPYYSSQWGLNSYYSIKIENIWNITKGNPSITVAVVDGGIYTQHPDLSGRIHPYAYNCQDGSNSPGYHDHGTMCAGIIAANHNNIAIAGIAPNIKLMNISSPFPNTSEKLANGINNAWQNGADVINNSWGSNTNLHSAVLESAISNALTKGRNGKGCVVCFSSGNNKTISYPASCNPDIMVVGAFTPNGTLWESSGRGDELDVIAPGAGIISLTADGGISDMKNGTSYASPHVAGIAALILSVYPNLTQQQVCSAIIETTGNKSWNKNTGWGSVNAEHVFNALYGNFHIASPSGATIFATSKFYIPNLPKSAKVQWSTTKNIAHVLKNTNDTIIYQYNFSGRSMTDTIKATVTYYGKIFNFTYPVTVHNEPRITGVKQIFYEPDPNRIDLQVNCMDPFARFTWSGSNNFVDFPYLEDASFMQYPNIYKSIYIYNDGTYSLTVRADNQYAYDIYNFQIVKSSFGIQIIPSNYLSKKHK